MIRGPLSGALSSPRRSGGAGRHGAGRLHLDDGQGPLARPPSSARHRKPDLCARAGAAWETFARASDVRKVGHRRPLGRGDRAVLGRGGVCHGAAGLRIPGPRAHGGPVAASSQVVMRVPLIDLAAQEAAIAGEALAAIERVAREGRFILGAPVEAFERWLARACGAAHAVGVGSGTDALELSLRALGVGAGDAVIAPALSFVATAEAIAATGARPVFCDVDAATMNASAGTVEEATDRARAAGMRVRAVIPVHLFGRCAPVGALRAFASREGLALGEDAAQAIGALDEAGQPAGRTGGAACFSFFPTKNLGAWGDGGAVVTSRLDVAMRVRQLRAHGAVEPYVHVELGRNSR